MKYVVLLYQDERIWAEADESAQQATIAAHDAFSARVEQHPDVRILAGEALRVVAEATTLRRRDGRTVLTDGPFAETAEQLGGFYVVEAPDLDTLLELVEVLPADCSIEVRPVDELV
ncbi:YciI family protein [Desertihabitans aurantiacus]|uniref:YciI family protein n=1 Tax=Desertihabitans aurantiacus TaxID=2282477 RepID=UPI000DF84079|nr:YciI family protein [Desertihabitans aurantiacus]